jgi:myo-inositol-1-phosphate synthase
MLSRAVEKKSVCGCSFVSSHDVHKSHIEVASGEAILADISMAVSVAKYVACECKCRDMDTVDCSPTVLEEGVPPRVHEKIF